MRYLALGILALFSMYGEAQTPSSFSAHGQWKLTSGEIVSTPVKIDCSRTRGVCIELIRGVEHLIKVKFKITHWDSNDLSAQNNKPVCISQRLIISFRDHSVFAINAPKSGSSGFVAPCSDLKRNCASCGNVLDHTETYSLGPEVSFRTPLMPRSTDISYPSTLVVSELPATRNFDKSSP